MFHLFGHDKQKSSHSTDVNKTPGISTYYPGAAVETPRKYDDRDAGYRDDRDYRDIDVEKYPYMTSRRQHDEESSYEPRKEKKSGGWFSNLLSGGSSHHDDSAYDRERKHELDRSGYQMYRYKPESGIVGGDGNGSIPRDNTIGRGRIGASERYSGSMGYNDDQNVGYRYGYGRKYDDNDNDTYYDPRRDRYYGYENQSRENRLYDERPTKMGGRWDKMVGGVQSSVGRTFGSKDVEFRGEIRKGMGDAKEEIANERYYGNQGDYGPEYPRDRSYNNNEYENVRQGYY